MKKYPKNQHHININMIYTRLHTHQKAIIILMVTTIVGFLCWLYIPQGGQFESPQVNEVTTTTPCKELLINQCKERSDCSWVEGRQVPITTEIRQVGCSMRDCENGLTGCKMKQRVTYRCTEIGIRNANVCRRLDGSMERVITQVCTGQRPEYLYDVRRSTTNPSLNYNYIRPHCEATQ